MNQRPLDLLLVAIAFAAILLLVVYVIGLTR